MSSPDYEPTRVAQLTERFRESSGLSVRKAASMAEISEGRWQQLAKGYQQATKDVRVPVNAPPETLARMAVAVGMRSGHFYADQFYEEDTDALTQEVAEIVSKSEKTYPELTPVFGGSYEDPNYLANVEGWIQELQERVEMLETKVAQLSKAKEAAESQSEESDLEGTVVNLAHPQSGEPEQKIAAYDRELGDGIQPGDLPDP